MIPPYLSGVRALADDYDVFVVDLWGTLHDGVVAYRGAVECLERLAKAGKRVVLLSNAPRRAALVERTVRAVGIGPELYALLMTSGEAVYDALQSPLDDWHKNLKGPCWHLGPVRDRSIFDGLDFAVQRGPEGAGFCVATGVDLNEETVDDYKPLLDRGLEQGLKMICANPDLLVPVEDMLVICAGAFAEYYRMHGGNVAWHGKPHRPIYERVFHALEALGGGPVDPKRTIAIGDGLHTDIAGAARAGIAGALVLNGVHRPDVRLDWRGRPDPDSLGDLFGRVPSRPDYLLPRMKW